MAPEVKRAAVLVPGGGYPAAGPLLMYAGLAVERRAGHVHRIAWTPPGSWDTAHAWVADQVTAAISEMAAATAAAITGAAATGAGAPLLIGKSLGSLAAPLAADRGLPAIWFTPLLTDPPTVAALRRATAPCLLVGGTADELWDAGAARSVTPHVAQIAGADHGMFVPGELSRSAAVLGEVITAVERFLDEVVWPDRGGALTAD